MTSFRAAEVGAAGHSAVDPWRVVQDRFESQHAARDEALFCLANGTLGVRAGFEESPDAASGSFLADVWERLPISYHERHVGFARTTDTRVPIADATRIAVRLGDEAVDLAEGEWLAFERVFDLRAGCTTRRLRWRSPSGATLEIFSERMVPFAHPGLLCIRYSVTSIDYGGPVALTSSIHGAHRAMLSGDDPRIGAGAGAGLMTRVEAMGGAAALLQRSSHSGVVLACTQEHVAVSGDPESGDIMAEADAVEQTFSGSIVPGGRIALEKFVEYAWARDGSRNDDVLVADARSAAAAAAASGYDRIAEHQARDVADFWRVAELGIDGDPSLEQALRFNLYHVFQSAARDSATSTAAKGLTGEGYEGQTFWDTEVFMLPPLALTAPALARGMLEYRHRTLDHARAHAREMGHRRGALFAWRTISGDECSSYFPGGSAQYHINAAIAYAIRLYVGVSGDEVFLREYGAEMLFETARIWLEIGHFNARRGGAFCIDEVSGPDEYTAMVDNNHYTNRMAQVHLDYAVSVARRIATEEPNLFAHLAQRLAMDEAEIARWSAAAEKMYLPHDEALGIFPQDDTFLDKPQWDFAATPADHYPLLMHYHPLTIYRHQVCKQADVVLALVLAGEAVDRDSKRRNFDYYERITVHDSTLSASTFSVLASEVGYPDKALRYLHDTARVDLDDLHGNAHHGVHMAAMAGSWLALVWGFAGMRVARDRLVFAPTLPAPWRGYHFGLTWRGSRLHVRVDAAGVHYMLSSGAPLEIDHAGRKLRISVDSPASAALQPQVPPIRSRPVPRHFKALIFDLDGVITDTARMHYGAWKRLADELGVPFDETINQRLKGVDRETSLEIILERASRTYSAAEKRELADRKNGYYRDSLSDFGPQHLLPGARDVVLAARAAGLATGLASASRNAALIVARLGIANLFDYMADANCTVLAKPDPEIFLKVAHELGCAPADCLGIEDAAAGIAAIKAAGMTAVGIGDPVILHQADAVLADIAAFRIEDFVAGVDAARSTAEQR